MLNLSTALPTAGLCGVGSFVPDARLTAPVTLHSVHPRDLPALMAPIQLTRSSHRIEKLVFVSQQFVRLV